MKTRSMIPLLCVAVALAVAGCSDDTVQPGSPDATFNRPGSPYSSTATTATPDDGTTTGGTTTGGTTTGTLIQRPLSDFLSQQGTFCMPGNTTTSGCMLYAPPVGNFAVWYAPAHNMTLVVDYAGLMDAWLRSRTGYSSGTTFNGNVYEQPLADGRAKVMVNMNITRAMFYIVSGLDLANGPVYYGYRMQQLMQGEGQPAFGQASLRLSFINPAPGQPLPDLVQLLKSPQPDDQMITANFRFESDGEFRNEFGQRHMAHISVTSKGQLMPGYPGMESSTPPMAYVDMQIMPQ